MPDSSKARRAGDAPRISAEQVRWYRLRRSGLAAPFPSPERAACALFGIQAQVNSAARLALWHRLSRGQGDPGARIEAAIEERRKLVRTWGQRGTLHLYDRDDWTLVCSAMGMREISRMEQRVRRREAKDGTLTRAGLAAARRRALAILRRAPEHRVSKANLEREGSAAEVAAHYGAFLSLCLEGHACRVDGGDGGAALLAWRPALFPDLAWEPPPSAPAMVEVARRFLRTYGPATEPDLRHWLSCAAAESKGAVLALKEGGELAEVTVDEGAGTLKTQLIPHRDLPALLEPAPPTEEWPIRLLGRFDPLLLAHADKSCWIDPKHYKRVWHQTQIEATLLVEGRIRGAWRSKRSARGWRIGLELFDGPKLSARMKTEIRRQAEGISTLFKLPLLELEIGGGR